MPLGWKQLPSGLPYYGEISDGDDVLDGPPVVADIDDAGLQLPAKNARKADWVHAALNLGLEPGGLSKDEVITLVEEHVETLEDFTPIVAEVAGVDLPADPEQPGTGPGHQGEA